MSAPHDHGRSERELVSLLSDDGLDVYAQCWAIGELKHVATDFSVDALAAILSRDNFTCCCEAQAVLADIGTEQAIEALSESLQAADPGCVAFIARSLVKLDARHAVPALVRCLEDRREELGRNRDTVIWALGAMPHRSAISALAARLRDGDRHTRSAAAWALVRIRAPESAAALEAALAELPWMRRRAVQRAVRAKRTQPDG